MAKDKEEMFRTSLYLPLWMWEGLLKLGKDQGRRTAASIIREACGQYLAEHGIDKEGHEE